MHTCTHAHLSWMMEYGLLKAMIAFVGTSIAGGDGAEGCDGNKKSYGRRWREGGRGNEEGCKSEEECKREGRRERGRGIHQSQEEVIIQRAKNMVTRHMSHAGHMTHVSELRMVT